MGQGNRCVGVKDPFLLLLRLIMWIIKLFFFFNIIYLAALYNRWDLSSLTRD